MTAEQREQAAEKPKAVSVAVGDGIEEAALLRGIRLLGIGAATGFASALLSVGGGTAMVSALALGTDMQHTEVGINFFNHLEPSGCFGNTLPCFCRVSSRTTSSLTLPRFQVVGTSLATMVLISLAGLAQHV